MEGDPAYPLGDSNTSTHTNSMDMGQPERVVSRAASLGAPIGSTSCTTQVGATASIEPPSAAVCSRARAAYSAVHTFVAGHMAPNTRVRSSLEAGLASIDRRASSSQGHEDAEKGPVIVFNPQPRLPEAVGIDAQQETAGVRSQFSVDRDDAVQQPHARPAVQASETAAEAGCQRTRSSAAVQGSLARSALGADVVQDGWTSDDSSQSSRVSAPPMPAAAQPAQFRRSGRAAKAGDSMPSLFDLPPLPDKRRQGVRIGAPLPAASAELLPIPRPLDEGSDVRRQGPLFASAEAAASAADLEKKVNEILGRGASDTGLDIGLGPAARLGRAGPVEVHAARPACGGSSSPRANPLVAIADAAEERGSPTRPSPARRASARAAGGLGAADEHRADFAAHMESILRAHSRLASSERVLDSPASDLEGGSSSRAATHALPPTPSTGTAGVPDESAVADARAVATAVERCPAHRREAMNALVRAVCEVDGPTLAAAVMFAAAIEACDYVELDRAVYGLLNQAIRDPGVLTDGRVMAERFKEFVLHEIIAYRKAHSSSLGGGSTRSTASSRADVERAAGLFDDLPHAGMCGARAPVSSEPPLAPPESSSAGVGRATSLLAARLSTTTPEPHAGLLTTTERGAGVSPAEMRAAIEAAAASSARAAVEAIDARKVTTEYPTFTGDDSAEEWFDYMPDSDRQSPVIRPPLLSYADAVRRQHTLVERRRTGEADRRPELVSAATLSGYFNLGRAEYPGVRGETHLKLLITYLEVAVRDGPVLACQHIIGLLKEACRQCPALATVRARVLTESRGRSEHRTIKHMLYHMEREVLPIDDDVHSRIREVRWHPTDTGVSVATSAFELLSKLQDAAMYGADDPATRQSDAQILQFFRARVADAQRLAAASLLVDAHGKSAADYIWYECCTSAARARWPTVDELLVQLQEGSLWGHAQLKAEAPAPAPAPRGRHAPSSVTMAEVNALVEEKIGQMNLGGTGAANAATSAEDGGSGGAGGGGGSESRKTLDAPHMAQYKRPGNRPSLDIDLLWEHRRSIPVLRDLQHKPEPFNSSPSQGQRPHSGNGPAPPPLTKAQLRVASGLVGLDCAGCMMLNRDMRKAQSIEEFAQEHGGKPTGRYSREGNTRPCPREVIITHPFATCSCLWSSAERACNNNPSIPLSILRPLSKEEAQERFEASRQRAIDAAAA